MTILQLAVCLFWSAHAKAMQLTSFYEGDMYVSILSIVCTNFWLMNRRATTPVDTDSPTERILTGD
jgi:hypothetical protein